MIAKKGVTVTNLEGVEFTVESKVRLLPLPPEGFYYYYLDNDNLAKSEYPNAYNEWGNSDHSGKIFRVLSNIDGGSPKKNINIEPELGSSFWIAAELTAPPFVPVSDDELEDTLASIFSVGGTA